MGGAGCWQLDQPEPQKSQFLNVWSAARLQGKSLDEESLRQCIRPVCGGFYSPGHDEIRRVPVLQNPSAV